MIEDNAICFQPQKPLVDTEKTFCISKEGEYLKVENENVSLLYNGLSSKQFDEAYNFLNKYLDFDFSPVELGGKKYVLSESEQQYIIQETLTSSIYFYTVNRIKIVLKEKKMNIKIPFDTLLEMLTKKYGPDTPVGLAVGAHILRQPFAEYANSVRHRRQYYNK